jgi:hypothetical protein
MNHDPPPTFENNDDSENTILDLQMTIVAMQTEQEVALKNKEAEAQNQIRSLQEQLRRLQNETNVLRSRQHQQSKKQQQQPQSSFTNFEKSIPPPLDNTMEIADGLDSPAKIVPTFPLTNRDNFSTDDDAPIQLHYDFSIRSQGERLIHHLLLCHPQQYRLVDTALEQGIERVLTRMLSSSSTSSSILSEWDVVQWFVMEILQIFSIFAATNPNASSIGESPPPSSTSLPRPEQLERIRVLLHWLYDALSLSPSSCIYFRRCATKSNDSSNTTMANGPIHVPNPNAFVRRSNTITGRHGATQEFRRIEQHLSHPLSSTSSLPPLHVPNATSRIDCETKNEDEPSYVQCCFIQRLMLFLQTLCTFSWNVQISSPEASDREVPEFRLLCIDLSILSMQLATLLLQPFTCDDRRDENRFFWDGRILDTVLTNVISFGALLLTHFTSSSTERRRYNDFNSGPPRRLAHVEYLQQQEKNTSFALFENKSAPLEENIVSGYMKWIVEAIHFLHLVIWTKNVSVICSPNLERTWMDTKRTTSVVSLFLDLLQHVILPDATLYNHPLTSATVSFFHGLIRPKKMESGEQDQSESENAEEKQNYFYWRLLLCHHVTDHSTEELWRTGPTAIDVLVQLLHRIVVRQLVDDHLPNASSNTLLIISLIPVRDQIIRFIHRVLLYVQNDRRLWETEDAHSKEQGQESKRKKPLSFTTVLSENVELFQSAAGTILSIPPNDDCIHYCYPGPDIQSMLTLQINELLEDATEQLQN